MMWTHSPPFGLLPLYHGKKEDYPLLNAKVHYDLCDVQMLADLTQTYTSRASTEAEIRYVFPLPPDASVCSFKAVIDGKRTVKGVVKEKVKAKAEYEQAVAQGKTAALLQQTNVEIFQVSLGNIHPNQTIEVHISFVCVISHDGSLDSLRLTFPSIIAPRYGSPPSDILRYSWGHTSQSNSALDLSVAVEMTSHIKSITSPSHPIAMKLGESTLEPSSDFNPFKARVSLSSPILLEKDVVIVLSSQGLDKPRCMVESFSPEEGGQEYTDAYALTLVPRFELPPLPSQEYIFLVDRSGSMGGGKMDAVRSALQIMLMSLPARGTSFNIISFGTGHNSLWPSSVTYSADSVKAASTHVDSMSANYGGTQIGSAIEGAFASRAIRPEGEATPTSVFILTDGEAYDLDGVQSVIQNTVAKAKADNVLLRVFCMGIGNSVSKAMCDGIARAGQGTATFVGEQEKPDQKLMGLLRAARGAMVTDISIDWGVGDLDGATELDTDFEMVSSSRDGSPGPPKEAAPLSLFDEAYNTSSEKADIGPHRISVKLPPPPRVQQAPAPASLPPLYPGFRASLFAIVRRGQGGNTSPSKSVRVKGAVLGRPVVLEVPVSATSNPPSTSDVGVQTKMLHVLAARALIQSVEDKAKSGTYMSELDKAEVLRLAERYGLASSQTSFVAIDEEGESVEAVHDDVRAAAAVSPLQMQAFGGSIGPINFSKRGKKRGAPAPAGKGAPAGPPPGGMFQTLSSRRPGSSVEKAIIIGQPSQAETSSLLDIDDGHQPTPATATFSQPTGSSFFGTPASAFGSSPASDLFAAPMNIGSPASAFAPPPPSGSSSNNPFTSSSGALFGSAAPQPPPPSSRPSGLFGGTAPTPVPAARDRRQIDVKDVRKAAASKVHLRRRPMSFSSQSSRSDPEVNGSLPPTIESFARSQSFDGSFIPSPALFHLLVQQAQAPIIPTALGAVDPVKETLWCTLLCVAWLEMKLQGEKDVWAMIVEKAMTWVEDTLRDIAGDNMAALEQGLKEDARKCIR